MWFRIQIVNRYRETISVAIATYQLKPYGIINKQQLNDNKTS